jgi:hypothetical protein
MMNFEQGTAKSTSRELTRNQVDWGFEVRRPFDDESDRVGRTRRCCPPAAMAPVILSSESRVRSCTWKRWPFITRERRETPQRRGKRTDIHRLRGHVKEMREQAAYLAIEHTNELATPGTGMPRSRSAAKQKACSSFKGAT